MLTQFWIINWTLKTGRFFRAWLGRDEKRPGFMRNSKFIKGLFKRYVTLFLVKTWPSLPCNRP